MSQIIPVPPYGAPQLHETSWIAPGAIVVGDVTIGSESSVWYNAVVRGDRREFIVLGLVANEHAVFMNVLPQVASNPVVIEDNRTGVTATLNKAQNNGIRTLSNAGRTLGLA